jgi:CRISPR system Cascade subunit CasC
VRTRRLIVEIAKRIASNEKEIEKVTKLVSEIFKEGGIERPEKGEEGEKENTKLLFFMNEKTIDEMAQKFKDRWDDLTNKETKDEVIKELGKLLAESIKSPDIALFGRMLEIDPKKPFGKFNLGVYAASQVAHAISTHSVRLEFDYFTAVDDLLEEGQLGAGMIGTTEFNSACFYRYLNVNTDLLKSNLQGDEELTRATVEAFVRAAVEAIPTGKQNSHEKPSFVLAVARSGGMCSLANAFVKSARANENRDLISDSVEKLENHWRKLAEGYGDESAKFVFNISNHDLDYLKDARETRIGDLIEKSVNAVLGERREA